MTILEQVLEKLAAVDATLASLHAEAEEKKGRDGAARKLHEAINAVRGASQFVREHVGNPEVQRQSYSLEQVSDKSRKNTLVERHESYGVISASKPTGSIRLVGSTIDALPSCVELKIHRARRELDTDLHTEYYYPDNYTPVISIRLSVYQWAELISSMTGMGVPCTMVSLQGVSFDRVPEETKTPLEHIAHQARQEATKMTDDAEREYFKALEELDAKIEAAGLSKKRADELKAGVEGLRRHVTAPKAAAAWASQRMAEDTEKSISQAKVEMAAAFDGLVLRAGMRSIEGRLAEALVPELGRGGA